MTHDADSYANGPFARPLADSNPYLTERVNRFGVYERNPQRKAPAINYGLPILQTLGGAQA